MYMGTESEVRKRFPRNNSFGQQRQSQDGRQRSFSRNSRYDGYNARSRNDKFKSPRRQEDSVRRDRLQSQNFSCPRNFPCCIGCKCKDCYQNKKTCEEIKKLILEKLDVKMVDTTVKASDPPAAVNLCKEVSIGEEMVINYTYMDMGRQMMILDIGALVSIAGVSWMRQYLEEFDLEIEDMKSVSCHQPFVFGPSKRYVSISFVELPLLVTRLDRKEEILVIQTYLVDTEVPF